MITFFTTLKPHHGHIAIIQRNALRSWLAVRPDSEVLVMGDEAGAADLASEVGATHLPQVPRNQYGTPVLGGMFDLAERHGRHRLMCYINADILLMSDFAETLRQVLRCKRRFLMVGRRWDCEIDEPITFDASWEDRLRDTARRHGRLQPPTMIDYFVYPRSMWGRLPPFAIGRTAWDNWLIYRARCLRVPVIDATRRVMAVHQNHDYAHVTSDARNGADERARQRGHNWVWRGPEARTNFAMAGGKHNLYTIWDTTHELTERGLTLRGQVGLGGGIWSYRRSARASA